MNERGSITDLFDDGQLDRRLRLMAWARESLVPLYDPQPFKFRPDPLAFPINCKCTLIVNALA